MILNSNRGVDELTEKDLNNIHFLKLEIQRIRKVLSSLSPTGRNVEQKKDYIEFLKRNEAELIRNKTELETLISKIDDAEIRLILKLKFVDFRSWNYVARTMHYDRSTVQKKYKKFINREQNK